MDKKERRFQKIRRVLDRGKARKWIAELLIISLLLPSLSLAGTLRLSPGSGTYDVGESFTVDLLVDSDEPMNTAGATISFDPGKITVSNISDNNSLFSMWPEDPEFSNDAGTISFGGGMPGDSFTGTGGEIISITFNAEGEGETSLDFTDGQIIAAGADITNNLQGASYSFEDSAPEPEPEPDPEPTPEPEPEPEPTPEPEEDGPTAPEVTSSTHPDQDEWYSHNSPELSWDLDDDVEAVRIQVSSQQRDPTVEYDPPIDSREVEDLDDGVWYFTLQAREDGSWGEIATFEFRIDTTPPADFDLNVDNEGDETNPTPIFNFETSDQVSGIDEYEIRLNDELYDVVEPEDFDGRYQPSSLSPGDYFLEVEAFDMARNSTSDSTLFSVEPLPLEVDEFPTQLEEGQELRITGETAPEATVYVHIDDGEEERVEEVQADGIGRFEYREVPDGGEYRMWIESADGREARSLTTEAEIIEVSPDRLVLILTIALVVLILVGLLVIFFLHRQIKKEQEKKKEEQEKDTIEVKREAYEVLESRIKEQIDNLEEKVDLSRSESQLLDELRESLKVYKEARAEDEEDN